jgi:hypothetical protein
MQFSPIKWWSHSNIYIYMYIKNKKKNMHYAYRRPLPEAPAGSSYALCLPGVLMHNIWKSDKMKFSPTKCNLVWHLYVTLLEFTNNLANCNLKKSIFYRSAWYASFLSDLDSSIKNLFLSEPINSWFIIYLRKWSVFAENTQN